MSQSPIPVYIETGKKRSFAGAVDWPGWARSGPDEPSALQALFDYAPRYARVLEAAGLEFTAPSQPSDFTAFTVTERLEGNSTTDFGAPAIAPSADSRPVDEAELRRFGELLQACWRAFDLAVDRATGKTLRTGPRGGGRDVDSILEHVLGAEAGYISQAGWKFKPDTGLPVQEQIDLSRQAVLETLAASAWGEIPARGPRGGLRWSARYFARRLAWHVLDHAWEIEDRTGDGER